jgi:hypothetical protein
MRTKRRSTDKRKSLRPILQDNHPVRTQNGRRKSRRKSDPISGTVVIIDKRTFKKCTFSMILDKENIDVEENTCNKNAKKDRVIRGVLQEHQDLSNFPLQILAGVVEKHQPGNTALKPQSLSFDESEDEEKLLLSQSQTYSQSLNYSQETWSQASLVTEEEKEKYSCLSEDDSQDGCQKRKFKCDPKETPPIFAFTIGKTKLRKRRLQRERNQALANEPDEKKKQEKLHGLVSYYQSVDQETLNFT